MITMMNGEDTQPSPSFYGYSDPSSDLSRTGSKRRRLLGHRLAEDSTNPELEWPSAQHHHQHHQQPQHAPNFFDVTTSSPSRMNESPGLAPQQPPPPPPSQPSNAEWPSQQAFQPPPLTDFRSYESVAAYNSHPYFYAQNTHDTYASSWPPTAGTQAVYGGDGPSATAYSTLLPAQQESHPFQDGAQYLNPHGGSKMLFDTTMTNGYTPMSVLDNDNSLSASMNPPPPAAASVHFADTSRYHSSLQVLPNLDRLSTQIVQTVAQSSLAEVQELLKGTSTAGRQYLNTINLFEQARRTVAPGASGFIDASITQNFSPPQQDSIRKANTAIFVVSVLGASNTPFFQLDQAFLDIFVPLGHRLLKWQGAIYLELKTQTYIMAVINGSTVPETLLDELFPLDLESHILQRHPDAPSLSPSEQDFIDRCRARRQYLLKESYPSESRSELPNKYQWNEFLREFSTCISKNIDHILSPSHRQSAMHGVMNRRRAGSGPVSYDHGSDAHHDVRRSVSSGGHAHRVEKKSTASGQTIRQAWVKAEEEALIAGLERVGGPHWSQILALYGRGGSISEVLKDRNQVQLKDKARNLKLWYLKMGQEVPVSLRGVTGELRKRGGARARAALEAEEQGAKDRRSSDEHDIDPMLGVRHDTVDPGAYDHSRKK